MKGFCVDLCSGLGGFSQPFQRPYEPSWSSTKNHGKGSTGLLRLRDPAKRAVLPYGLGLSILRVIEGKVKNS